MVIIGVVLVWGSQELLFKDTGDFIRVIEHLKLAPIHGSATRWRLPNDIFARAQNPELASWLFTMFGWLQRYLPGHVFDLVRTALVAKVWLLGCAALLSALVTTPLHDRGWGRGAAFVVWAAVFFMAHNISMAQTFFPEYAAYLALPLLVAGFLMPAGCARAVCVFVAALACGLAKVQYFYVPLLILVCVVVANWWQRTSQDKSLLALLVVAQVLCLGPLALSRHGALNAHQSLYLGSYMVLAPEQLDALGVPAEKRACIGIDAWGNQTSGPGGTQVKDVGHTCYPEQPPLSMRDTLRPYLAFPQTLPRLMQFALPYHFTVHYFHVYSWFVLLQRLDDGRNPVASLLVKMSEWRDRTVTPLAPLFLVSGLVFFAFSRKASASSRRLALAGAFLSAFIISQIVVSLLGEGIRDLSKHLWAAQLALDMLVAVTLFQVLAWLSKRGTRGQEPIGARA